MATAGGRVLITFDVDGTLIHSVGLEANKLHKDAFAFSFKEVFGITGTIDAIKHHGSTDLTVASRTLEHYGVSREAITPKLAKVKEKMLEYSSSHEEEIGHGLELLPGVWDLMQILSGHPDVVIGLVTGNLEPIAWLKMKALGLLPYFSAPNFGGFGSDDTDRGELVKIAAHRAQQLFPGPPFGLQIHVGDTPNDILAAEYGGALPIGVCTGIFTEGELRTAGKTGKAVILEGLSDMEGFLKACGLTARAPPAV